MGSRKGPGGSQLRTRGGVVQPRRESPSRLLLELANCIRSPSLPPLPLSTRFWLHSLTGVFCLGKKKKNSHNLLKVVRLSRWVQAPRGGAGGRCKPLVARADGRVWALEAPSEDSDLRAAQTVPGRRESSGRRNCLLRV